MHPLVLAVVAAVNNAYTGGTGSAEGLLAGFRPAILVSVIAAVIGLTAMLLPTRLRPLPAVERA